MMTSMEQRACELSDVITYEFENITHETARWLEENAYMPQGGELLRVTQDRYVEKTAIKKAGLEVAPFEAVDSHKEILRERWRRSAFLQSLKHERVVTMEKVSGS